MKSRSVRKIISLITSFSLLFQTFLPLTLVMPAYAEDIATDSATPIIINNDEPTSSAQLISETATDSAIVSATDDLSVSSNITSVQTEDNRVITYENVAVGNTYTSKDNKVTVTFTEISGPSGSLSIKEITLTSEQIARSGALSDIAYDITSTMEDGTFKFDLTLPKPDTDNLKVKYSEDGRDFVTSGGVSTTENEVVVSDVNHFTIFVVVLEPSWDAPGGGGVFSAYVGPTTYSYLSPGNTAIYDGREAGVIKAGINADTDGHYYDEGLFGFKPNITINIFASNPVAFDVANQEGSNPVWMTIEIDTGSVGNRSDNTTYQFVPTSNPSGWHTVNASSGLWQKWNNGAGDTTGNPLISIGDITTANTGLDVVRVYLRLGMGDSYHGSGSGTVAWVDKIAFGGTTYDFIMAPACDSTSSFDSMSLGSVNGQDGWSSFGSYDQAVVPNSYGFNSFGCKTLRLSNGVASGSFGDQTFSVSNINEAGESTATNGGQSGGTRQNHFEAKFDFSSTQLEQQPGLVISVSPDRGDGSRMSYLRFEDSTNGINVFFDDVSGITSPVSFDEVQIASNLSRSTTHNAKFVIDFVDGPSNDIVKIYIDDILVKTGTTWENYYRFDNEASAEQGPRTTDNLIFRAGGSSVPANIGKGFLFDNISLSSSTIIYDTTLPSVPVLESPINNGYKNTNDFYFIWNASTDDSSIIYEFQSSTANNIDNATGSLIGAWNSITNGNSEQNHLTLPKIHSIGAPDGTYYWQVRAIDAVGNKSAWTTPWKMTIDTTIPGIPSGIYFKDTDNNKNVTCGSYTSAKHLDVYWNANTESDFDHYEYISFNSDGSTGSIRTFTTNYFNSSWWTIPAEGTYGVQINAVDKAGNKSAWYGGSQGVVNSCKFIVDWQAPSVPVLIWPINIATNDNTPLMQWNDSVDTGSSVSGYNYLVRYQCTNASDVSTCSAIYPSNPLGLWITDSQMQAGTTPDGIYYWQVNSQDMVGNVSAWSTAEKVIIDTIKPVITIAPYTTSWTNQDITVTASVNEGTLNTTSHIFSDNNSFTFTVTDAAGNSNSETIIISNIDKDIPLVSANNSSSIWKNIPFNITLSASDIGGSNISTAKYNWDSAASEITGTDFVDGNTISALEGDHVLYLFAKDNAGNLITWSGIYKLDSTAPSTPENISPVNSANLNIHNFIFSWSTVSDPRTPVIYEWESSYGTVTKVDGSFGSRLAFHSLTSASVNSPGTPDNTYYWHVRALDSLGNASAWSPIWKVIVDTVAPTASVNYSVTTPINGSVIATITPSESVTITSIGGTSHEFTDNGSFTFYFVDASGNTGEVTATVSNIDKTFPTSVITLPSNTETNQTVFSNSWDGTITGTANDNVYVDHVLLSIKRSSDNTFWNGEEWIEGTENTTRVIASNTNSWFYILSNPNEDTYTIISHAVDTAGNVENSYSVTIVLDKTIPEVTLSIDPVNPDAENGWYKTQPTVTLTANDKYEISKIEYQWNNQTEGNWTAYSSPFKPSTEGGHVLYYRAWDRANNVSDTGIKNIKWDQTELESGPLNISADPNPTSGTTSKIKWEAAKDNTGIDKYEIHWYLNGGTSSQDHTVTVGSDVREKEIDQLVEGRWTVSVRAFDTAGHSKDATVEVNVDRNGPVAPVLTLTGTGVGTASLSWNAVADAKDYIVWYGNTPGGRLFGARVGNTTSYTVRGLGAGNYYFIVKAVDEAQNQGAESNEVNTGNIVGAPGVAEGTPAEGFTPQVQGVSTEATPSPEPTPSILGTSTNNNSKWWWLLLLLIPFYFGGRRIFKKE